MSKLGFFSQSSMTCSKEDVDEVPEEDASDLIELKDEEAFVASDVAEVAAFSFVALSCAFSDASPDLAAPFLGSSALR